jgi:hypothetical protein
VFLFPPRAKKPPQQKNDSYHIHIEPKG